MPGTQEVRDLREDFRFKLTESESVQWRADVDRIHSVLGRMPRKALVLVAVHILAQIIDRLDLTALIGRIE